MANKMKDAWSRAIVVSRKIAEIAVPILVYGTYSYFTRNDRQRENLRVVFEQSDISADSLYGRAANAICNSDMNSYDKNQALSGLKRKEPDEYYEAVISIANSRMNSYDRADSICDL